MVGGPSRIRDGISHGTDGCPNTESCSGIEVREQAGSLLYPGIRMGSRFRDRTGIGFAGKARASAKRSKIDSPGDIQGS